MLNFAQTKLLPLMTKLVSNEVVAAYSIGANFCQNACERKKCLTSISTRLNSTQVVRFALFGTNPNQRSLPTLVLCLCLRCYL